MTGRSDRFVSRFGVLLFLILAAHPAFGEVTGVTIASRTIVANGQAFGTVGAYEKLTGTVAFALDPSDPRNARVVDLRAMARRLENFPIKGRDVARAGRDELLAAFRSLNV